MDFKSIVTWALIILVALFSIISVIASLVDKSRARKNGRRISEATLMSLAALGGAAFMFLTMIITHHKTKHIKFMLGLPLMIIYQAMIVYLIVV